MFVNIACGTVYVDSPNWRNFDYAPVASSIKKANLLSRLTIDDASVDVVYSSHFFEHIPRNNVREFVKECYRILKSGGKIRLVLPDLEELCREYISQRDKDQHVKADFVVHEMLDQCVRKTPGGELKQYFDRIKEENDTDLLEYIKERTGDEFFDNVDGMGEFKKINIFKKLLNFKKIIGRMEQIYVRLLLMLLPAAFRQQNISFTHVGERHTWIYDFYSLSNILQDCGFVSVEKKSYDKTSIEGFPLYPLDVSRENTPRKGRESMYIEATKL